jgi:hypothetical protein
MISLTVIIDIWLKSAEAYTGWRRETGKFEVDYEILPRGQVPPAQAIRTWVRNFEETGSALKKKPSGVYCLYVSQRTLMLCKLQW